ncbi:hypothetical protein BH24ACI5_BH24ACI5_09010 [soil metagenome]
MNSIRIRRAAAVVVLTLATAAGVSAQDRPAEFEGYRAPGLTFLPGISLGVVRDSNVALASTVDRPASGQLFVVEPFGQLELISPLTEFVAGYKGHMRRYTNVEQLNGMDHRLYLSVRRMATRRLTVFAGNDYADVPTTDEVELNGLPFTRTGARSNRLTAGIEARLSKYTDLNVRYESLWVKFDRTVPFPSDGWVNAVQTDLRRRLSERLSVGAEYGIRRADLQDGARTVLFQDIGGLVAYAVGPHTRVEFSGGFSFVVDTRLDRDRRGPYVRGEISHDVERATIGGSFERSFVPTFGFGGTSESHELRGYVRMPLHRNRLYVQSTGLWRRTSPLLVDEFALDTLRASNTLGYAAVRWLRLEAYHIFTRQDSRIAGGEVNRQRAGVQVVFSQPMRIR